jgi:hypothetical protein
VVPSAPIAARAASALPHHAWPGLASIASAVPLELRSDPDGAIFTVDGRTVGPGPIVVPTRADREVDITASLPDHETWTRRISVARAGTVVVAELPLRMEEMPVQRRRSRHSH